ncbi:MAG: glutathione S-transferase family protein [Myxococcota bacterium]
MTDTTTGEAPRVYGASVSYYTGKLEAYLRYKEIPYEFVAIAPDQLGALAGASQVPAVHLPDGRWMTDSTPIIDWYETQQPAPPILPEDPAHAFLARLIEDWADEWLWRPAMHYRWSYDPDRELLSRKLAHELMPGFPLPGALKRFMVRSRQKSIFVTGDGVSDENRAHVEGSYLRSLDLLSALFADRPYCFGSRPTLADIGLVGPMLRHFSHDPTPAVIMQNRAPAVWEWLARLWNARGSELGEAPLDAEIPSAMQPLLQEIVETHFATLRENAAAFARDAWRHDVLVQGVRYRDLPTSRYRVWCWEELHRHAAALTPDERERVREHLPKHELSELVFAPPPRPSEVDTERRAPFGGGLEVITSPESQPRHPFARFAKLATRVAPGGDSR